MSRGCFTSYILFWDLGDLTTYGKVRERFSLIESANIILGYFSDDVWMIAVG
jgi:hypothetical protein